MNSFPKIKKATLFTCFERIVELYLNNKPLLVQAAQRITVGTLNPIIYSSTEPVDRQLGIIRTKIGITSEKEGQTLFIKWVEELYEELIASPVAGVTWETFLPLVEIRFEDESVLSYTRNKVWEWSWKLKHEEDEDILRLRIRGRNLSKTEVVPNYVLNNVQQAIAAFDCSRHGACLSLLSISLESALRDSLIKKGYSYVPNTPAQDSYTKLKMHIHKDSGGFKVTFPQAMPLNYSDYLNDSSDLSFKEVKIKRALWNGNWILQISSADDLLDYWSSDQINIPGQKKVEGLGTALKIARDDENIIDQAIFPTDFDKPIITVRNNLIHLSEEAMRQTVYTISSRTMTLKEYIDDKARVFDTICSVGGIIDDLYFKISSNSL
ncbi:MAG TPA: hypothetical protein VIH57_04110 [Bacteroidales bacterium]